MDAKRAAEVLRRQPNWERSVGGKPSQLGEAGDLGAQALEALHWWFTEDNEPHREAVRIQREEAGVRWTSDEWIAAVLDAMEQEGKG